MYEQKLKV